MKERIERHRNGTIKAKGHMKAGELVGYWEWLRKDGTQKCVQRSYIQSRL
jgi:hypothetical protein